VLSLRRDGPGSCLTIDDDGVSIEIPAAATKNRRDVSAFIGPEDDDGLRDMLLWYEDRIRPLVLRHSWGGESLARSRNFFPIDPARAHRWYRSVTDRAELFLNPHMMRSVMVTLLLTDNAMSIEDAASMLGVSVTTVEENYAVINEALLARRARAVTAAMLRRAREESRA
jgi:hypothetical protein